MNVAEIFRARGRCTRRAGAAGIAIASLILLTHHAWARFQGPVSGVTSNTSPATIVVPAKLARLADPFRVKNYLLDFAGDHSLSGATVTEQALEGRANYFIRFRLASGAEQSVIVAGPPGGLQIEMHDMTGDNVPNDVVLRPALFSWLPTVLVNDGHDHFAVVVSGAGSGSFSSPQNLGSRPQNGQAFVFLRSPRFKSIHLSASKRMLVPRPQQPRILMFSESPASSAAYATPSDRAPPFAVSI